MKKYKIRRITGMTSEVSMASMSDIAFLLIIFFMVSSAFVMKEGLHLTLPDSNSKPVLVNSSDIITIRLTDKNLLLLEQREVTPEELTTHLTNSKTTNILGIVMEIEGSALYSNAVSVIDRIKGAGYDRISLKKI